jgi:hypothetical protein
MALAFSQDKKVTQAPNGLAHRRDGLGEPIQSLWHNTQKMRRRAAEEAPEGCGFNLCHPDLRGEARTGIANPIPFRMGWMKREPAGGKKDPAVRLPAPYGFPARLLTFGNGMNSL